MPTRTLTLYSADVPTTWDTSGSVSSYFAISHTIMFVVAFRMASSSDELRPNRHDVSRRFEARGGNGSGQKLHSHFHIHRRLEAIATQLSIALCRVRRDRSTGDRQGH